MGTARRFWNWQAERYAKQPIADEASYRKKLEITQRYLDPSMEVVEFGCGTGATAVIHAPKVARYHAIDVSEKMVEIGRRNAVEADVSNLTFSAGTLEEVGPADGGCDAILALNILHLVPDLEATVATVERMLRPGGCFVSSTICAKDLSGRLAWLARATKWIPVMPTVGSFSVDALLGLLDRKGFEIEERFEQRPGVLFLVATKRPVRDDPTQLRS